MAKKYHHIHVRLFIALLVYLFILVFFFYFLNQKKIGIPDFFSSLYPPSTTTTNDNNNIDVYHANLQLASLSSVQSWLPPDDTNNTSVAISVIALSPSPNPSFLSPVEAPNSIAASPISVVPDPSQKNEKKRKKRKQQLGSLEKIENGLARVRQKIRKAIRSQNYTSYKEETFIPRGSFYRNPYAFHQSHIEMEKRFKIWCYKEGEQPLVHDGPVNNIYGIEGQFIDEMESGKSHFIARHPDEAHAFLIPISVAKIIHFIYRPLVTYSRDQLQRLVADYIGVIADKYPYWNRSNGADHFLISCHDWAPQISYANPDLFKNFIRVLCNANKSERFQPQRDISIPEIKILERKLDTASQQGIPPSKRTILAFFAGGAHGYIRKVMLKHWKEKDNEVRVYEYLKNKNDYFKMMGRSKFCLCPSGYEVASPRVVEAIHFECVPVIISDNYSLPFNDVFDWSKFSVHISSEKIPKIKTILKGIPRRRYLQMLKRVIQIRRHFVLKRPAQPYDLIHMVLHSLWLRRLNVRLQF